MLQLPWLIFNYGYFNFLGALTGHSLLFEPRGGLEIFLLQDIF